MNRTQKKIGAAKISIATAVVLALVKLLAGIFTGSLAVLSAAIDSMLDIVMSGVNFLAIRQAEQPADANHPYGHGKFETVATLLQAFIIGGSGVWILIESIHRLSAGIIPDHVEEGVFVLAGGVIASWFLSRYLQRVARETDSTALAADALHYSMDVYTNGALLVGLIAMYFLRIYWVDAVLSMGVSVYILSEAVKLIRIGLSEVLDEQLPEELRTRIEAVIQEHGGESLGYHSLRTRKGGSRKLLDFHLSVCKHLSVGDSHSMTEVLEAEIEAVLPGADVTIHVEPCVHETCVQASARENMAM